MNEKKLGSSLADKLQILRFSSQKCLLREWWLLGYFQKSPSDDYFSVETLTQAIHSSVSHYSRLHFETPIDVGAMKFMWFRLSRSHSGWFILLQKMQKPIRIMSTFYIDFFFSQVIFMPISSHPLSQVPLMNTSGILMPLVGRPNVIFICNELLVFVLYKCKFVKIFF